ncbi:MAG: rhomboid family intramembrane serine protease [Chthoniobacteraceae bacterium]
MSWINRAESRFGHLAIPGLPRIIVGFNALVFVLYKLNPHFLEKLSLDRAAVMNGEVWRLITFLFIPGIGAPFGEWLFAAFYILFLWFVANGLEEALGAFRMNLFYFLGMIGTMIGAFFFGGNFSNAMLNTSMFLAFARFYPDVTIYLFLILPVKVKWLAWITAGFVLLGFLANGWSYRAAVIAALANYLIFFGAEIIRDARDRSENQARRRKFEAKAKIPDDEPMHQCHICGKTELTAPDLEFRVARDGQEYCREHLPKAASPSQKQAS